MDQLCPPKSVDPMTVLPRELAETILDYLSFRQRMNACLVSRQWAHFLRSVPNLWHHLDLSGARRKVRTAFISRVINIARARLKVATLSNLYDFDKTLSALVKHCPLEELTLLECGLQSHNLTAILAPAKSLRSLHVARGSLLNSHELQPLIAVLADRLETLECWLGGLRSPGAYHVLCPQLKSLSVTFDNPLNHDAFFGKIAERFPALETLIVRQEGKSVGFISPISLRDCHKLRHLEFRMKVDIRTQLQLPPSLNTLWLDCRHSSGIPVMNLPMLDELSIEGRQAFEDIENLLNKPAGSEQEASTTQPSHLRKVSIRAGYCAESSEMIRLVSHPRFKHIGFLELACCTGIKDQEIAVIASAKLEKLETLDLSSAELTGVGVKTLVSSLNINTLILNNCAKVSPDAVEWARSKGVTVKHRMSVPSEGGRKVRY